MKDENEEWEIMNENERYYTFGSIFVSFSLKYTDCLIFCKQFSSLEYLYETGDNYQKDFSLKICNFYENVILMLSFVFYLNF